MQISKQVSTQISEERDKIKAEVEEMKNRFRELHLNRQIISTGSAKYFILNCE